ncbi:peptidylprolyl isomerase [Candidatus Clavichlamydia salmonicola]|uniref:peptidylprolyl isomerase n=1 Tax=Candidatus Clavichlamydia salmonicola TaxID=469812 RepID=UPI001890DD09|nr:peptidylprolyl isomerase [Candidatus Clavichlamydia salmonicola]
MSLGFFKKQKSLLSFIFLLFIVSGPLQAGEGHLMVHNRTLFHSGKRVITAIDVMRKMDLIFYQNFPNMLNSKFARYRFYNAMWRTITDSLIDEVLIVSDAEEKKITVNDSEIKEELERIFGLNVVNEADMLGMTLEDVTDLIKKDLLVQKMLNMIVRSRAMMEINPQALKDQYRQLVDSYSNKEEWVYAIVSLRGYDKTEVFAAAKKIHDFLSSGKEEFSYDNLKSLVSSLPVILTCSEEYVRNEQDLSDAHKKILLKMTKGTYSDPVWLKDAFRIFYFKDIKKETPPQFNVVKDELQAMISREAVLRLDTAYREKLRMENGCTVSYMKEIMPDDCNLFSWVPA